MSSDTHNSPSRTKVSLRARDGRKFDQIIALSQGNINESLNDYFFRNEAALSFDVKVGNPQMQLQGTLLSPTLELMDIDGADKALYVLKFGRSSKFTREPVGGGEPAPHDASGWTIAFEVDFALQTLANAPAAVKQQINKPGEYSVAQLVVVFNTPDAIKFNMEKSRIVIKDKSTEAIVRDAFKLFVGAWLEETKMRTDPGKYNVLGYAVTTKRPQEFEPAAPLFPPTSARLQTIAHRPNGDASKVDTDSDWNAFLFTEMCGNREMITSDLPWSGELFYRAIGGTLVLSRSIFWEGYVQKLLAPTNQTLKDAANDMCSDLVGSRLGSWVISDEGKDRWTNDFDTSGKEFRYNLLRKKEHEYNADDMNVRPIFRTQVANTVWMSGSNSFTFKRALELTIDITTTLAATWLRGLGSANLHMKVICISETVFTMSSVQSTGKLDIDVANAEDQVTVNVTTTYDAGVIGALKALGMGNLVDMLTGLMGEEDMKRKLRIALTDAAKSGINVKAELLRVFNNQSKFVFPGAGSFDMKDPIFNDDGDLMLGLVYNN